MDMFLDFAVIAGPAIAAVSLFAAVVAAVRGILENFKALRAKQHASEAMKAFLVTLSPQSEMLLENEQHIDELRKVIEAQIGVLSRTDREFIQQGLHQANDAGSRRFAHELISRAHASM